MSRTSSPLSVRARRRIPRSLEVTVLFTLTSVSAAVLGVWWAIRNAETALRGNAAQLDEVVPELVDRPTNASAPLYFLIVGSDSRDGVDSRVFGSFSGRRGDVVMVVRLDPGAGRAQLLSIPRDTYVPIDGGGETKINAALAHGGAPLMVKTVIDAFDLPIHHYVEVDFVGFQALVDQIGGVDITFDNPARDRRTHLNVPAGTVTLDGFDALAYARSGGYQEHLEGAWHTVDTSDLGRIRRQHLLVMAIMARLKRPATLTESGKIVASFAQHVAVDTSLAASSLARLAFSMRGLEAAAVEAATLPTVRDVRDGTSVELLVQPDADRVLGAFRTGRPMDNGEATDSVHPQVLNEAGLLGEATAGEADVNDTAVTS